MNREDDFDGRLARWLEEGPFEAPDRAIDAAIQHARAHPRRSFSRAALWRGVMDRMHLTHVVPPESHAGRMLAFGVVAVAVVAIALVGSGAIQLNQPERLPAGVVGPAATATSLPASVTGTVACAEKTPGTGTTVGDITQVRGLVYDCGNAALSDARVRGTSTVSISIDIRPDQSADIWGTEVLTSAAGSWSGSWTGIVDKNYATHRIAGVLVGAGSFAGLQFRYTQTSNDTGTTWTRTGTVEAVPSFTASEPVTAPIAVSGTTACSDFGGTTTTVGGLTRVRGQGSSCNDQMSDPRLMGTSTRLYDYDVAADGTAEYQGTGDISNSGGRWIGVFTATVDKAGTFRVDAATFVGSGGYAGLQYRVTGVWPKDAPVMTMTGTISPIQ